MGKIEEEFRRKTRVGDMQKIVLKTIATTGIIAAAVFAPNMMGALKQFGIAPTRYQRSSIIHTRKRLLSKGLLVLKDNHYHITEKGKLLLKKIEFAEAMRFQKARWDGRWRILIFDIPEKRRGVREKIRRSLMAAGFVRVQDSVWLTPYNCEDYVVLLKADYKIGKDILYIIAHSLEGDHLFRKHFNLR